MNSYVIVLAVFYIGAVTVFMDAWAGRERLKNACATVLPKGFIGCLKAQLLMIVPEIRKIPVKVLDRVLFLPELSGGYNDSGPEDIDDDDEGLVTLTTGSTGMPKGADRTHGFLSEQFNVLIRHIGIESSNIDLTALPVFVFCNLGAGATSVLPEFNPAKPSEFDPGSIVRQIKECEINTSVGSPAFYEKLADYLMKKNERITLKGIYTGGAPVSKMLAKKFEKAFSGTRIEIVYGCTEAEPISSIEISDFINSDSSLGVAAGYPDQSIRVKIMKPLNGAVRIEDGKSIDDYLVHPGEVGEIVVAGPHVLKSYLGSIDAWGANKVMDGDTVWHRTGDAGMIEPSGRIYLQGRINNIMHSDSGDVYSLPYEQMLMDIEGVAFTAVMEVEGKIFVAMEPGQGLPQSQHYYLIEKAGTLLKELNPYRIFILNRIPRDPRHNSKLDFAEFRRICTGFKLR